MSNVQVFVCVQQFKFTICPYFQTNLFCLQGCHIHKGERHTKRIKILGRIWEQLRTVSEGQRGEERGGGSMMVLVPVPPLPQWVNILNDNAQ